MSKKILIVAPHADDEILGCGGYIVSQIENGAKVYVVFGTVGGSDRRQDYCIRHQEVDEVAKAVGYKYRIIVNGKDAELDTVPAKEITGFIDNAISEIEPDELFINYSSHHQDHKKMYDCAMASIRLKEGFMPPFIALYEYPFVNNVISNIEGGRFYAEITDFIDRKVSLFQIYKTQAKNAPSPLNSEGIKALARIRGLECGKKYAELFYIQKIVI